jgi:hypothetical protein
MDKESKSVKKMILPIGQSDFREIIEGDFDFVDKSDFIPAVLRGAAKVILITRPRRFGKTLNMYIRSPPKIYLRILRSPKREKISCVIKANILSFF